MQKNNLNSAIHIADKKDIPQIKTIWKECFTTDENYLNSVFDTLFPMVEPYVYKEAEKVLSTLFLIPILFKAPCGITLKGKYLYGVATTSTARGRKLSIKMVENISSILKAQGDSFIITRPANETLFNFYKAQGFTIELAEIFFQIPQQIIHLITDTHTPSSLANITLKNNMEQNEASLLFNYIAQTYPKRFEWNIEILNYMAQIGEFDQFTQTTATAINTPNYIHEITLEAKSNPTLPYKTSETSTTYSIQASAPDSPSTTNKNNPHTPFVLIKPLASTPFPDIYKSAFFNFTME